MKILIKSGTKIIIILIVLTLSIPSSGQKGYQDGYVITNENGEIKNPVEIAVFYNLWKENN